MVRGRISFFAPILAALVLAMPMVAASSTGAKDANTIRTTMAFVRAVTLGGKQLKPGNYDVSANDTKVTVAQDGKVVAEASVQWKDETKKPAYSNIVSNGEQVTEMHFAGKMKYAVISG